MIVAWSPAALRDFDAIVDYIAADNPIAAIKQGDMIQRQVAGLLEHSKIGRTGRVRGTRELVIIGTPYIAAYRIKGSQIQILRVLHGAQQWPDTL